MSSFSISQTTVAYGLTNAVNALNIGMSSNNDNAYLHFAIDTQNSSKVDFEFILRMHNGTSQMPTFFWTDSDWCISCFTSYTGYDSLGIPDAAGGRTIYNADRSSPGSPYSWYWNLMNSGEYARKYNFICDFTNNKLTVMCSNLLMFECDMNFINNNVMWNPSPRRTANSIKIASIVARKVE